MESLSRDGHVRRRQEFRSKKQVLAEALPRVIHGWKGPRLRARPEDSRAHAALLSAVATLNRSPVHSPWTHIVADRWLSAPPPVYFCYRQRCYLRTRDVLAFSTPPRAKQAQRLERLGDSYSVLNAIRAPPSAIGPL